MPPLLQSPAAGNQTCALLSSSLSQSGLESSKGLRESLTHAEESNNVLGKMMTIFNTDLQHDKFVS